MPAIVPEKHVELDTVTLDPDAGGARGALVVADDQGVAAEGGVREP